MTVLVEDDRTYWQQVLAAGGATTLPRWSREPGGDAVAEHRAPLTPALVAALDALADDLGVSRSALLLAAHAKVLAALTGEREVGTRYRLPDRSPLPCRLSTAPSSWRDLVRAAHRAEQDLLRAEHAVARILSETERPVDAYEATLEAIGRSIGAEVPERIERMIGEGALGRKAGRGFYAYDG